MADGTIESRDVAKCVSCATELAPLSLVCPSCNALVHAAGLKTLAAKAEQLSAANDLAGSRDAWTRALARLPEGTQQHDAISAHISALNATIARQATPAAPAADATGPRWKRGLTGIGAALLLALSKLKFLLLGLTKASTFFSMFAFFGVYWAAFGWPLALGLVVSIYIHEMGHVAELKRLGIDAGAPMFIPGLGALVRLRQHIDDPIIDARIGLAGPIWGLGAGVAAWLAALATKSPTLFAIAQLTGYINLFNLIPIWQLDGSRGFHALDRMARWAVVVATVVLFFATSQRLLVIIAGVGAFRAFQPAAAKTDNRALVTFVVLLATLTGLASLHVVGMTTR